MEKELKILGIFIIVIKQNCFSRAQWISVLGLSSQHLPELGGRCVAQLLTACFNQAQFERLSGINQTQEKWQSPKVDNIEWILKGVTMGADLWHLPLGWSMPLSIALSKEKAGRQICWSQFWLCSHLPILLFNEGRLILFYLRFRLQKLARHWQDSHCLKTELEGLSKPRLLVAGNQPDQPWIVS